MSHFSTLVLVPADTDDVEAKVTELLAPYDENGELFREGSRWDWWVIGGRWTGDLSDYDPQADPANHESCSPCGGSGLRTDDVGRKARLANPSFTCNGCQGAGWHVKWPTEWRPVPESNIVPVAQVPQDFVPFALVTPDGKWREQGRMLWFATVADERDSADWAQTFRAVLGEWPGALAVIVDCHV